MPEFRVRAFDKVKDFEAFKLFLDKRKDESVVDFTYFPPTGGIVFADNIAVCAGFMIKCDNKTVINTDIVSDPDVPKEIRNEAVIKLREYLAARAWEAGYAFVIAVTENPKLVERLKEQGYTVLNTNLTHLGRKIWL